MSFFQELKRRNVLRVGAAYVVVSWVIIEVVVTLRDLFPEVPLWLGQALIIFFILGIVPVLAFSWYYELTPEGFKRDENVSDDRSYSDAVGRRLIYVTIAGVFVGLGLFAWTRTGVEPAVETVPPVEAETREEDSVAVLPFVNLSRDPDNEYFSDGLTETLLHLLAQVRELKVTAGTSVFAFKGKNVDIRDVAARLGVAHVLEGSVQRDGERVRVTAQLIRARDGFHLWSESYDRQLTDIFSIQDEIAAKVGVTLLASMLNPADMARRQGVATADFEAYDLYLRARAEKQTGSHEAYRRAEQYLEDALRHDPGFADAKVLLAEVLLDQGDTGLIDFEKGIQRAGQLLEEVTVANPGHAEAQALQLILEALDAAAVGRFSAWGDIEPRLRELIADAPDNIGAQMWFAFLVSQWGNREEAISTLESALQIDPLNPDIYFRLGMAYERVNDYESARRTYERSLEIDPDSPNTWWLLGDIGLTVGDGRLVIASWLEAASRDTTDPELPMGIASFLYEIGLSEEARPFHQHVKREAPDSEATWLLDMQQALAAGSLDDALVLAREVIAAFPSNRMYAWRYAWPILMFTSVSRNAELRDLAFVDEHVPEYLDLENLEVHGQVNTLRFNSMDVLSAIKSEDELEQFAARIKAHYRHIGFRDADLPHLNLEAYALHGQYEEGILWALAEVFPRPPTTIRMWRLRFNREFLKPIMDDARVRKELRRWDREEARMREEVRAYLAERY